MLKNLGFSEELLPGEKVLPMPVGTTTEFNAEGKEKILKEAPKETVYYPREWSVKDWGGYEHSGVNYMPYERYPRELIPPPGFELQITEEDGRKIIISRKFKNTSDEYDSIKHGMNMLLEIFKDMQVYKGDMTSALKTRVIRLNWELLPPGINPWKRVSEQVKKIADGNSLGEKAMIADRFKHIEKYNPNQVAIGLGGFTGYLVFGFTGKNIYLLESLRYGNATYVFGTDWQTLSQMTKAEILQNDYHEKRVIHNDDWINGVNRLLS
ncbi:MAG: hypothetical protein NTX97_08930 [Bacteroidetes bacterium]|nr:hypothetical protein [Bacteroidota bacterium]